MTRKIFGIELGRFASRTALAVAYAFVTLLVYYEIPNLLLKNFGGQAASGLPLENDALFFSYAILITLLSGLQIIFEGHFVGDAASVSNGIAQIVYIYVVASGGLYSDYIASAGIALTIDFRTILYLMMIPSALSIISTIVSASSRVSIQRSKMLDEITLA